MCPPPAGTLLLHFCTQPPTGVLLMYSGVSPFCRYSSSALLYLPLCQYLSTTLLCVPLLKVPFSTTFLCAPSFRYPSTTLLYVPVSFYCTPVSPPSAGTLLVYSFISPSTGTLPLHSCSSSSYRNPSTTLLCVPYRDTGSLRFLTAVVVFDILRSSLRGDLGRLSTGWKT